MVHNLKTFIDDMKEEMISTMHKEPFNDIMPMDRYYESKIIHWFNQAFVGELANKYDSEECYLKTDKVFIDFFNKKVKFFGELNIDDIDDVDYEVLFKDQKNPIDFIGQYPFVNEDIQQNEFSQSIKNTIKWLEDYDPLNYFDQGDETQDELSVETVIHDILKKIRTTIGGQIRKDDVDDNYKYYDLNNATYNLKNVASGVKVFSFLELFLSSDDVYGKKMIILDEPETSLHPEWQVFLSEILVEMVDLNFQILLITHSPFIIQGIKYYSRKSKNKKALFYCSEMVDNFKSRVIDVTNKEEVLFNKLSSSLNKVSF
jgi:hypothetical protein